MGCLESDSFLASDSIFFDHSHLLNCDRFHPPLLGNELAQLAVEVFITAAMPTAIRIGKEVLDVKSQIDGVVISKPLVVGYH